MSLHKLGLLAYSQGFALSRDGYIFQELGFCNWTGHHHVLFKYTLPPGMTYVTLSEDVKAGVDRQTLSIAYLLNPSCLITTNMNFIPTIS